VIIPREAGLKRFDAIIDQQGSSRSLMRGTLFSRLVASYIIIFSMVLAASIYTIRQLDQVKQVTYSILRFDHRLIDVQKSLSDSFLSQIRYEKKCILMEDYALYDRFLAAKSDFDRELDAITVTATEYPVADLLKSIRSSCNTYQALVTQEVGFLLARQPYDRERFSKDKDEAITKAIDALKQLGEYSRQSTYSKIEELDTAVTNSRSVSGLMVAATLLFGIGISVLITRSITRPLSLIKTRTQEIASGNFDSPINLSSPPEIAQLAHAFNVMCEKLHEVDKMKTEFFSLMAHELRTPLTSIKEGTNLLLEGIAGDTTEKQKRLLQIIEEEDKRLISLVNSLLDLSKMEAGMMTYNRSYTNLLSLIKRAIVELEPLAQAKQIYLQQKCDILLPAVLIDAEKINQVLRNLIGNAIKFTPGGGTVTISAQLTSQGTAVSVADTGSGIPQDDLQRIFDKYQQVRRSTGSSVKGTGLGLAIVKHIIHAHGGTVWVESELRKGSVFTFVLPA